MALIRIDGVAHTIFGQLSLANQTNATAAFLTPTRTGFTFQIGPVDLTVTFFSPIEVRLTLISYLRPSHFAFTYRPHHYVAGRLGSAIHPIHIHLL